MYLIHDTGLLAEQITELSALGRVAFVPWAERDTPPPGARVLMCLGDEMLRELSVLSIERQWQVGVLPHPEATQAMAAMGVKGSLQQVFTHYLDAPVISAEALTCNDELVFSSVVIGRVRALRPYDINRPPTFWSVLRGALKGLGALQLAPYTLTTGKNREVHMAALGMVVVGQSRSTLLGRAFTEELAASDSRLALLALAPRSILGYLLLI